MTLKKGQAVKVKIKGVWSFGTVKDVLGSQVIVEVKTWAGSVKLICKDYEVKRVRSKSASAASG